MKSSKTISPIGVENRFKSRAKSLAKKCNIFRSIKQWNIERKTLKSQLLDLNVATTKAAQPISKERVVQDLLKLMEDNHSEFFADATIEELEKTANGIADIYLSQKSDSAISPVFVNENGITQDIRLDTEARTILDLFDRSYRNQALVEFGEAKLALLKSKEEQAGSDPKPGHVLSKYDKIELISSISTLAGSVTAHIALLYSMGEIAVAATAIAAVSFAVAVITFLKDIRSSNAESKLISASLKMADYLHANMKQNDLIDENENN